MGVGVVAVRGTNAHMMCTKMSGQPICLSVHFHPALCFLHFVSLHPTRLKDPSKSLQIHCAQSCHQNQLINVGHFLKSFINLGQSD